MCRNLGSDPCDPNLPAYLIIQGSPRSGSDDYTLSKHFYWGPKTCALILFLFFYEDLSIYAYLNAPKRHVRIWKKHLKHHGKSLFFMVIPVVSVASMALPFSESGSAAVAGLPKPAAWEEQRGAWSQCLGRTATGLGKSWGFQQLIYLRVNDIVLIDILNVKIKWQ